MKILADPHIPYLAHYFAAYGELMLKPGRMLIHDDVKEIDILLVRSITPVNEKLLANTNVKFVGSISAGADHIDAAWLQRVGIPWRCAMGFNAVPVADYVVCVIAALQHYQRLLCAPRKKAAVIGVGHVGRIVAARLALLNFEVILCDPLRAHTEKDFVSTPLTDIADVDFISLHVPLTKTAAHPTYHFIDDAFLQRQKSGCILLNASRGGVIDSAALIRSGQHLQGCFDVWEHEPNINMQLLERAVIATPHIAGHSIQGKIRGIDMIYRAACELGVIAPHSSQSPVVMPTQTLTTAATTWQEIVLSIFNPQQLTEILRKNLLSTSHPGVAFDHLRNHFNDRHEFAFTKIISAFPDLISTQEKTLLQAFGIEITACP